MRVVHEVQHERAIVAAVPQAVQLAQRGDAALEHAFAALALDELLRVAGERGDYLDLVRGEKRGKVLLARLAEDGEIAPVHHVRAERARIFHQLAELRMQLGRAAGDVQSVNAGGP